MFCIEKMQSNVTLLSLNSVITLAHRMEHSLLTSPDYLIKMYELFD